MYLPEHTRILPVNRLFLELQQHQRAASTQLVKWVSVKSVEHRH